MEESVREQTESHEHGFSAEELLDTAQSAAELVREVVARRPLTSMAVGLSVGYVLGGGLPKFATRLLGAVGLRILAEGMIRGGAGRLLAGFTGEEATDGRSHAEEPLRWPAGS